MCCIQVATLAEQAGGMSCSCASLLVKIALECSPAAVAHGTAEQMVHQFACISIQQSGAPAAGSAAEASAGAAKQPGGELQQQLQLLPGQLHPASGSSPLSAAAPACKFKLTRLKPLLNPLL